MAHHISWSDMHTGHDICDRNGTKIGTVSNVVQRGRAIGGQQAGTEGYVQCDCCLPDFAKQLYIPLGAFRDCDGKCCYVDAAQNEVSQKGWDRKPAIL